MAGDSQIDSPRAGCRQCPCPGEYTATFDGLGPIASYRGKFPSPLPLMWYVPTDVGEATRIHFPASEIRGWLRDAAHYEGVPLELAAVILQQENGPNATGWQKVGQFAERSGTTFLVILDEMLFDLVPDQVAGHNLAGGSSGIANLSRATLRDAARYIETTYCRPILPDHVKYRLLGWNQDTRIPGDDLKADLYYMTGHLRQLIDRITGTLCYSGPLTLDQVERILAAYNGSGPAARKYGRDAMHRLRQAAAGKVPLYFYER